MSMNRGIRRYEDLFPEEVVVDKPEGKGRSQELLAKRDERLCDRFYFLAVLKGMRYDDILLWLEDEFEISRSTISERIQLPELTEYQKKLKGEKPHINFFRKKWVKMVWQ